MKFRFLIFSAALMTATPALAQAPAAGAVVESKADHSTVSLAVDPKLDDGRLVIKLAAENRSAAPVVFGPSSVEVKTVADQSVPLMPLQRLTNDVRLAAGMQVGGSGPNANAYSTQPMTVDATGHLDVTNYSGSMGISGGEMIRQSNRAAPVRKPTISRTQAEQQIATLNQAILKDATVQPGQVAAGEIVTVPLKFAKGSERTLHVWVRIAGDEHTFTIAAPEQ